MNSYRKMMMTQLMAQSKSSIFKNMSSTIDLYMISKSRRVLSESLLYISSRNYSNHSHCSLDQLASDIELTYNYLPDIFNELTVEKVIDIQNLISIGKYTLSSLELLVFSTKDNLKGPNFNHIFHMLINNTIYYGCVTPIQEDKLVLMALGRMLNHRILDLNLLNSSSFGLKTHPTSYYAHIRSIKVPISRLSKLDMTNSLRVINKESLLTKLEPIVKNDEIMKLLKSFLYMPIKRDGKDLTSIMKSSIPSSGLITDVLLNFSLIELDNQFHQLFPSFSYTRYVHEVIVTTSQEESSFEESLLKFFDRLNLAGKILSIGPGDNPIPCHHGGIVWVSEDGRIQMKEER